MTCKADCHLKHWAAEVSDLHGLKHVAGKGSWFRRGVWLLLFLGGLFWSGRLNYLVFKDYFSYGRSTILDVDYKEELTFPAITICNFNKYRESLITANDIVNVGVHLGIVDSNFEVIDEQLYTEEFVSRINAVNWTDYEEDPNFDMVEFTNRTGHQIDEMIVQCEFGGQECTADDFEHVFTHQGNCFTFNGYKEDYTLHESKRAGAANGLKLVLDADTPEYTPSNDLDGDALDAGFRIAVHHNNEPPYVRELGLSIGPGVHSFITMQREHVTALPAPYTTCEESGNVQYYDHYSLQACRIECETLAVVTVCGCKLVEQPGPAPVCNASDSHECAHPTLVNFMNGQLTGVEECECQTPCDLHYYPIAVSSAKLRPTFIEKTFENTTSSNMSIAYISDNIAVTTIYYEALNMRKIDIVAATGWFDVLSSLGGNFGLFLGASLLTIVQFLEYLVDECMYTFSKKKKVEPDDEEAPAENGVAMKVQDIDEPEKKDDAWATEYS